jgi:hypothetical protein
MYPNKIGFADFGVLKIECLEIFEGDCFQRYSFRIDGQYLDFADLCNLLNQQYPTIAKLLQTLGREKFLNSVLIWDPSDAQTKKSFYCFLADQLNEEGSWALDDQPF